MGYYDILRQRVTLPGFPPIRLAAKAGLPGWETVEPSARLLAELTTVPPGGRFLLLEGGAGALAAWAARQASEVHSYDHSLLAARSTRETAALNGLDNLFVYDAVFPDAQAAASFDAALLLVPKGRDYANLLLKAAYQALKPGAPLYLAGPNKGGIKSVTDDAQGLFGSAATLGYKTRHRVTAAVKGNSAGPDTLFSTPHAFTWEGLTLFTLPGIFSADGLDDGTALLLSTLDSAECAGRRVLDVGCGCGVIGLWAARLGAAQSDMVDASWLALDCTGRGISHNGLAGCRVWASDLYSDFTDQQYDLILSNPPFHAGHEVDTEVATELIAGAHDRLAHSGRLRIVANRFLRYNDLLADVFGNVTTIAEDTRYHVLEGRKS